MSDDKKDENGAVATPSPEEYTVTTDHELTLGGQVIAYSATAGTMILKEEDEKTGEKAKASVFYVAYTKRDVAGRGRRAITFSFNGGPGSSSVWLHLGLLGPRRVIMGDAGQLLAPPYRLVDNAYSLLDTTDLVFIDPVSTGYSRTVPGEEAKQFHDFEKDIESVGDFIRLYTSRHGRWISPKFLIGESYGTTRAAGLAGYLQDRHGLYLNGLMLISTILNFQSARFGPGNDLPYALFLPTYTATAWYHGRLDSELQQTDLKALLAEVAQFAQNEYTLALMRGDMLSAHGREVIARRLARFTGLSVDYILRTNLRIDIHRFCKELLRDQGLTLGRLDSRFTARDRDAAGEKYEFDPSMAAIQGPYTAALNELVRMELKFESDIPYEILTGKVHPWRFERHQNEFVNVAETLRSAMHKNPFLKVYVANGYFDLATPFLATEYTMNHLGLDPELRRNIELSYFYAGHMMYVHEQSLLDLKEDLARFVDQATPGHAP